MNGQNRGRTSGELVDSASKGVCRSTATVKLATVHSGPAPSTNHGTENAATIASRKRLKQQSEIKIC